MCCDDPHRQCARERDPAVNERVCTARDTDLRYEWLRVEWIEASLGAIGGEPTRIRNVRALIVRRHEVSILIVTGVGVGRYFGSQRRSTVSMMIMRPPQQGHGRG